MSPNEDHKMRWLACPICRGYIAADLEESFEDRDDAPELEVRSRKCPADPPFLQQRDPGWNGVSRVPVEELERVSLVFSDALERADSGKQADGYALLIRELARVEAL